MSRSVSQSRGRRRKAFVDTRGRPNLRREGWDAVNSVTSSKTRSSPSQPPAIDLLIA